MSPPSALGDCVNRPCCPESLLQSRSARGGRTMAARWFYGRDKARLGPFTAQEMKALACSGGILPEDTVWQEGVERGAPAWKVKTLFAPPADDPAAPVPPEAQAAPPANLAPRPEGTPGLPDSVAAPAPEATPAPKGASGAA